jgi:predicted nucleic acid-binding protein
MLVLDTNGLSAMMRSQLVPEMAACVATQPEELLYTTAICQAEVLAGIALLPDGQRRTALEKAARAMFEDDFDGRILPFDSAAAAAYADIFATRKRSCRPTAPPELMIAAIARANGAGVVIRDLSGFTGCGLTIINPWEAHG